MSLAVLIVTKNAAAHLSRCLQSVGDLGQVYVIDTPTGDNTKEIAEESGAIYHRYEWNGQYPKKRQYILDNLKICEDWILFLDADEVITEALRQELKTITSSLQNNNYPVGYFIEGRYTFNNKILRFGMKNRKLSLLRKGNFYFPVVDDLDTAMGEIEGHYQPCLYDKSLRVGNCKHAIIHYAHENYAEWEERHYKYANWDATVRRRNTLPKDPVIWRTAKRAIFSILPAQPLFIFIYSYIFCLGFLDGAGGLYHARLKARYYHMIKKAARVL
jgi:glycosyltransferase involved in cell wall biosynthesis